VVTVFILAALILAETTKHFFGRWIASTIYDNRAIFLSCDELPDLSDVKSEMEQHNQVIQEIKNIDPENIEITIDNSCPGKGSLIIYYPSHNDRTQIEELLGDSFFGIPWKGINR
jgi:hypothetical protein